MTSWPVRSSLAAPCSSTLIEPIRPVGGEVLDLPVQDGPVAADQWWQWESTSYPNVAERSTWACGSTVPIRAPVPVPLSWTVRAGRGGPSPKYMMMLPVVFRADFAPLREVTPGQLTSLLDRTDTPSVTSPTTRLRTVRRSRADGADPAHRGPVRHATAAERGRWPHRLRRPDREGPGVSGLPGRAAPHCPPPTWTTPHRSPLTSVHVRPRSRPRFLRHGAMQPAS